MRRLGHSRTRVLLWAPLAALVSTADATELSFEPYPAELACSEVGAIDVVIDAGALDLRGYSLTVDYDPTFVRPVGVEEGGLLAADACASFVRWLDPSPIDGSLQVDGAGLGCSVSGPGAILRLWFQGVADGVSSLTISASSLRTSSNLPIGHGTVAGLIQVNCPIGGEPSSWGVLKGLFR